MISDNQRGWCRGEDWWKRNERPRLVLKTEMQIRKRENETLVRPLVGPFRIRRLDGEMTLQRYKFLPSPPPSSLPATSENAFSLSDIAKTSNRSKLEYINGLASEKKRKKKKRTSCLPLRFFSRPPHMSRERELRSRACSSYVGSSAILCVVSYYSSTWVCSAHARSWSMRCKARKTGCFLAGQRVKKCRIPRVKREIHEFISRTRVFLWEDGSSLASFRMGRILWTVAEFTRN